MYSCHCIQHRSNIYYNNKCVVIIIYNTHQIHNSKCIVIITYKYTSKQ